MENKIYVLYKTRTENRFTDDYDSDVVAASYDKDKLMTYAKEKIFLHKFSVLDNKSEKPENISIDEFEDEITFYGRVSKLSFYVDKVKLL